MTDKSFGDHMNRNVVKNPLLSTAVTGLSLEDLTHNAVLLPVSLSQEVIARSDQQLGSQTRTLGHTDHAITNYPSGDANSNLLPHITTFQPSPSPHDAQKSTTPPKNLEGPHLTQSKASVKSDDDFDVNEYFARLQGTRYVSAPINSTLKEESNVNLGATEENLEEINLNEPEKQEENVQQSLTADIAQNFSQLPTVLPQVASAVFSSFSSMLQPKKYREPTPDNVKPSGYQEVQFERPAEEAVSVKEIAPPPREPPSIPPSAGTTRYRLPTKKKYAQIPGLTSGDNAQNPMQPFKMPPISHNAPSYFLPTLDVQETQAKTVESGNAPPYMQKTKESFPKSDSQVKASPYFIPQMAETTVHPPSSFGQPDTVSSQGANDSQTNMPTYFVQQSEQASVKENLAASTNEAFVAHNIPVDKTVSHIQGLTGVEQKNDIVPPPQFFNQESNQSSAVLPPPPMFSNAPRRDSQSGVGKAVLPPSVARRISANQPQTKTHQLPAFTDKIFTPPPIETYSQNVPQPFDVNQSAFAPFISQSGQIPTMFTPNLSSINTSATTFDVGQRIPQAPESAISFSKPEDVPPPNFVSSSKPPTFHPSVPSSDVKPSSMLSTKSPEASITSQVNSSVSPSIFTPIFPTSGLDISTQPKASRVAPPPMYPPNAEASNQLGLKEKPPSGSSLIAPGLQATGPTLTSTIFTPPSNLSASAQSVPMFTPVQSQVSSPPFSSAIQPAETLNFPPTVDSTPKHIPEPPKAASNVSYRLTKKRPQYYAGPIEGVGAISNNVKPVLPNINATFQGASTAQQNTMQNFFTPQVDNAPENVPNFGTLPFDITRTAEINYAPYEVGHIQPPQYQSQPQPDYNSAFDLSRPTTESYNESKDPNETGTFGLLGSLKSKLSSLDINKIQNSVTTFFDPAYNDIKKEASNVQGNVPYQHQQMNQYGQQPNNFEIFVPNVEQNISAYHQPAYHTAYPTEYNTQDHLHYYQNQDMHNYYQNPGQNPEANYFVNPTDLHNNSRDNLNSPGFYINTSSNLQENASLTIYPTNLQSEEKHRQYLETPSSNIPQHSQADAHQTKDSAKIEDAYSTTTLLNPSDTSNLHVKNSSVDLLKNISQYPQASDAFDPTVQPSASQNQQSYSNEPKTEESETLPSFAANTINFFDNAQPTSAPSETHLSNIDVGNTDTKAENKALIVFNIPPSSFFDTPLPSLTESDSLYKTDSTESAVQKETTVSSFFDRPQFVPNLGTSETESQDTEAQAVTEIKSSVPSSSNEITPDKNNEIQTTQEHIEPTAKSSIETEQPKEDQTFEDRPYASESQNITKLQDIPTDYFSTVGDQERHFSSVPVDFTMKTTACSNLNIAPTLTLPSHPDMASAPLFGLSTILADKSREIDDLGDDIGNMSLQVDNKDDSVLDRKSNTYINEPNSTDNDDRDVLNICETCREVNKSDDREEIDDLTNQLIENITSPIQLSNAVEVPLTESNTPVEVRTDFDDNQCAEISHITEETIETIQVQSATELLDDDAINNDNTGYVWSNKESAYATKEEEGCTLLSFPSKSLDQQYFGSINPNAIGFFGNSALFENSPSNKTPFGAVAKEAPMVLPRQMSIPTAPPEEDYTKSEAIDVHSIEQDAKKDFPLFEEFVIEPSNDDEDDRLDTGSLESFTSRVDKYQKKDEPADIVNTPVFQTSPSLPMASYFDTGNYAAETHYRNSLTTPTMPNYCSPNMRVPPGFEDEYQKLLDRNRLKKIPETTTQTRPVNSPTYSNARKASDVDTNVFLSTPPLLGEKITEIPKPATETPKLLQGDSCVHSEIDTKDDIIKAIGPVGHRHNIKVGDAKSDTSLLKQSRTQPQIPIQNPLPDPINFFATSSDPQHPVGDDNFNRLASYFSSSTKPEHTKSFFELSQSQNHYRHETVIVESPLVNLSNIPREQYLANLNLMRDLTSVQNVEVKPDENVRTVNYFTVEYDYENILKDLNKGEPITKTPLEKDATKKDFTELNSNKVDFENSFNEENLIHVVKKCKHCCVGHVNTKIYDNLKNYKVKKCMDENSSEKRETASESDKDMDHRESISVSFGLPRTDEEPGQSVATDTENRSSSEYTPVKHHWFYRMDVEGKSTWRGFSVLDSKALEDAYQSSDLNENTLVATDGGRYDVNLKGRLRFPVYWTDKPSNVRRCSWFYKGATDARYVPYTEPVAEKLEEEYRHGMTTGEWHRRLPLPNNELVVMHGPTVMVHFLNCSPTDTFPASPLFAFGKRVYRNPPKIRVSRDQPTRIDHLILLVHGAGEYRHQKEKFQSAMRQHVVRRGIDESEIEEVDPSRIDHLLLLCHGVGSACDMRFRAVEEVVDDFRATCLQLIQSHYKNSFDSGLVGRVEVLPISWHATLHSGETGVDRRMARITLDSIPRLRNFTNDTVLDVLFYTSPVFCQTILNTVCGEMNRIYKLFRARNPHFTGGVSLGGHSLGSVILYDLLCHQQRPPEDGSPAVSKQFVPGAAGAGQPAVCYPALDFAPVALYALGSPIAIFECIRGVESFGPEYSLPTCKQFFNIFHPYDPIAYRVEPLINPQLRDVKPSLIPHHKGRKRMHLELKDTMARVGADLKAKLLDSIKSTWSTVWKTQAQTQPQPSNDTHLEKVVEEDLEKEPLAHEDSKDEIKQEDITSDLLGRMNGGRRVDYVLQEAPFEMINEYIFAMSSHVCYWESEDTMLMMLREIYSSLGVQPDASLPLHSLTVQRTRVATPVESITIVNTNNDYPSTSRSK